MRNIILFSGSSHPSLVEKICDHLGINPAQIRLGKFSNGETSINIGESVREKDVYIVQSGCGDVNDNLMELLILIYACKTSSANRITAVMPYFCYSRQPDVSFSSRRAPMICKATSVSKNTDFEVASALSTQKAIQAVTEDMALNISLDGSSLSESLHEDISNKSFNSSIPVFSEYSEPLSEFLSPHHNNTNTGFNFGVAHTGTLIANLLTNAGANHVISMDLHDPQFQGFFNIGIDNLYCKPLIQAYIQHHIPEYKSAVIVSPDSGGAKRSSKIADALGIPFALIHKERCSQVQKNPLNASFGSDASIYSFQNPFISKLDTSDIKSTHSSKFVHTTMLVGDVRGKVCILLDDLVNTSYTITRAAKLLKEQNATKVYALVTHGVFCGDALSRVAHSDIDKIIVTNTVPQEETIKSLGKDRVDIIDVSRVFGEAIRRIHNGESISMLFEYAI